MNEYKINIPRLKLPKKSAKSLAKYLRKIVIDNAEERGLLTPENREEYLQRIDHEIAVFEYNVAHQRGNDGACGFSCRLEENRVHLDKTADADK